jgi:hypothetical protein
VHNQISRKRQETPCLELCDGRWRVYPVDVAGVNSDTLKYENWMEYAVFERSTDAFGNEYWAEHPVPEWAAELIAKTS